MSNLLLAVKCIKTNYFITLLLKIKSADNERLEKSCKEN